MPIEDVQYLVDNSVQDSSLLFVDSSKRDRRHHPTPSHYVVEFEEPMRNVFGIDVLDATIPGTMYNVDAHNDQLLVLTCDVETSSACVLARLNGALQVPPGAPGEAVVAAQEAAEAAALASDFYTLGYSADVRRMFEGAAAGVRMVVMPSDVFAANPPPASSSSSSSIVHAAVVKHSIPAVPLFMPQGSLATSEPGAFTLDNVVYAVVEPSRNSALVEQLAAFGPRDPPFALVPSALPWQASPYVGVSAATRLYDVVFHRVHSLTKAQFDAYVAAFGTPMYEGRDPLTITYTLSLSRIQFEPGNYTAATLQVELQDLLFGRLGMNVLSTSSGGVEKQGRLRFSCKGTTRFMFPMRYSSAAALLGFDLHASAAESSVPAAERRYNALSFGPDPQPVFMSVLRPSADGEGTQVLDSPGLMNLMGVRYITLRCREVEEHLGTTGKYGRFSTGIGVFKLASANEVAQLRFDFVSLIRKPFHPIGKLQRMTLRFELTTGDLYDFKGINHQLLMTIKYWSPVQKAAFQNRILNPDYNPDFMSYVTSQARLAARASRPPGFESSSSSESDRTASSSSESGTDSGDESE
jgi:hypothetical protein